MRLLLLTAVLACGQPAFEVATVKPANPASHIIGDLVSTPGGRVIATRCMLEWLLAAALDVEPSQIAGGPGWVRQEPFDIDARPPVSSTQTSSRRFLNDDQKRMLLTLLVERFQLQYHRETREAPVYFLVRTKKALKLEEAKDKEEGPWVGSPNNGMIRGDGIAGVNISMPKLAARLGQYLGRPVLDHTRLAGSFDFKFAYVSEETQADIASSILFYVQQLGLKLESGKGPAETIVIDRAEKPAGH